MDEIISYKMCAVKVRNAKLRNYLKLLKVNIKLSIESDCFRLWNDGLTVHIKLVNIQ